MVKNLRRLGNSSALIIDKALMDLLLRRFDNRARSAFSSFRRVGTSSLVVCPRCCALCSFGYRCTLRDVRPVTIGVHRKRLCQ